MLIHSLRFCIQGKRRADTPHVDGALRGDLSALGSPKLESDREQTSLFPSGAFDFQLQGYESLFSLSNSSVQGSDLNFPGDVKGPDNVPFSGSAGASVSVLHTPVDSPGAGSDVLSAAGRLPSSQSADAGMNFHHLLPFIYPTTSYDAGGGGSFVQQPFTHVNPTQLLGIERREQRQNYHPSPSSDGWSGELNSSTTASPEPFTSSGSTPPSTDSMSSTTIVNAHAHARSRAAAGRRSSGAQEAGRGSGGMMSPTDSNLKKKQSTGPSAGAVRHAAGRTSSSPDVAQNANAPGNGSSTAGGEGDDADGTPTVCTNCQTKNTPLWRRDPEGQPLCESRARFHRPSSVSSSLRFVPVLTPHSSSHR